MSDNYNLLPQTDEGFLNNPADWQEAIAEQIAAANELKLTAAHWEIVWFIRNYYLQYQHLPTARVFVKAIKNELGQDKGNSRYLQRLFPCGPLKFSCKIAGLSKPPGCL